MTATLRGDFYKIIDQNKNIDEVAYGKLQFFLVASMTLDVHLEIISSMDQRSKALYLSMKGLSGKLIHQELVQILHTEAVAYPTVTWYVPVAKFAVRSREASD
jgi:hypothetical protein